MRLTEPGLYVARDGRRAMSYQCMTGLAFAIAGEDTRCEFAISGSPQTEGEWQKIDLAAVTWPEFPPKPPGLCLVKTIPKLMETSWVCMAEPTWVTVYSNNCYYRRDDKYPSSMPRWGDLSFLEIVPHPDNDREAVAMIEAARKETGDV